MLDQKLEKVSKEAARKQIDNSMDGCARSARRPRHIATPHPPPPTPNPNPIPHPRPSPPPPTPTPPPLHPLAGPPPPAGTPREGMGRRGRRATASSARHARSRRSLRAYLSALNIRNKCKHPLFLVLRFDSCIALMYDTRYVTDPIADDDAVYRMMAVLNNQSAARAIATGSPAEFPPFLVAAKTVPGAHHDCGRPDCPVQLTATLSLPHVSSLPAHYTSMCDLQMKQLRRTYCRLHCKHSTLHLKHWIQPTVPKRNICDSCAVPHLEAGPPDPAIALVQPHAAEVLSSVQQMATAAANADGQEPCPEREWELGLRIIAEAMAQHCRSRSVAEIIGFMQDEEANPDKRTAVQVPEQVPDKTHAHEHQESQAPPTQGAITTTVEPTQSYAHEHAHSQLQGGAFSVEATLDYGW